MPQRSRTRLLVTVAVAMLLEVLTAPVASAVQCSGATNFHEAFSRNQGADTTWRGATVRIAQRTTTACTPDSGDSFSVAFAMLANAAPVSDYPGYAQIGYYRNDGAGSCTCERYFWVWSLQSVVSATALWGSPAAGNTVRFRVDWQPGDGKIHLVYDSNLDGTWEGPPTT